MDDHLAWSADARRATDTIGLVALSAVALLGATGVAVIAFATHATLLARRDMVTPGFISRLFEQRFLMLGVQAGTLGALLAFGAAAFVLFAARQAEGQAWLLPQLSLSLADGLILGLSPLAAGAASMISAKITVMRSLSDLA